MTLIDLQTRRAGLSASAELLVYFTLSVVLYGAVEHWLSGALVNVGDMI